MAEKPLRSYTVVRTLAGYVVLTVDAHTANEAEDLVRESAPGIEKVGEVIDMLGIQGVRWER
jgi:hypothetical protein